MNSLKITNTLHSSTLVLLATGVLALVLIFLIPVAFTHATHSPETGGAGQISTSAGPGGSVNITSTVVGGSRTSVTNVNLSQNSDGSWTSRTTSWDFDNSSGGPTTIAGSGDPYANLCLPDIDYSNIEFEDPLTGTIYSRDAVPHSVTLTPYVELRNRSTCSTRHSGQYGYVHTSNRGEDTFRVNDYRTWRNRQNAAGNWQGRNGGYPARLEIDHAGYNFIRRDQGPTDGDSAARTSIMFHGTITFPPPAGSSDTYLATITMDDPNMCGGSFGSLTRTAGSVNQGDTSASRGCIAEDAIFYLRTAGGSPIPGYSPVRIGRGNENNQRVRSITVVNPPAPQCSDGADNDGDGLSDFPNDPGCTDANDDDETDPPPPPSATISGSGCTIPIGGSSCNVTLTWNIQNAASSNVHDITSNTNVSNAAIGTNFGYTLQPGSYDFAARDGGTSLATANNVQVSCVAGSSWDNINLVCVADGVPPSATISGNGCTIPIGGSSCNVTLTWNIQNAAAPNLFNVTNSVNVLNAAVGANYGYPREPDTYDFAARDGATSLGTVNNLIVDCASGSTWDNINLVCAADAVPPSATISGNGCTIPIGGSSCNVSLTWDIQNAAVPNVRDTTNNANVSSLASQTNYGYALEPGTYDFAARDGATSLDTVNNLVVSCAAGSSWDGAVCAAAAGPPPTDVTITTDRPLFRVGDTVNVQWDPQGYTGVGTCSLSSNIANDPGFSKPANQIGDHDDMPSGTITYTISCTLGAFSSSDSVVVWALPSVFEN